MVNERHTAAVIEQWRAARGPLAEVRRRELRQMSEEEGLVVVQQLLDLVPLLPPKHSGSGLVEQQRLFARARG